MTTVANLPDIESQKVISDFNNTNVKYDKSKTIIQLFEEQVEKTPMNEAVLFNGEKMSYRELNAKSNQLANLLIDKGVKPNTIVGIMIDRSFEMIIGIFGILKAGGAYLPISTDNPINRKKQIVEDSNIKLLLSSSDMNKFKWQENIEVIDLKNEENYEGNTSNLYVNIKPNDLAYVIYTSGSTGLPKGVMIEHYSLINRINWMQRMYPINETDTILQKTPYFFDVSVWEIFWWSTQGAKLCLLNHGYEKFPQAIIDSVEKSNVTVVHFVPSMLNAFLNYIKGTEDVKRLKSIKQVFASGEALNASLANKFYEILLVNNTELANLYGPTEATVDVSYYNCPKSGKIEKVPIGKPIDNISFSIIKNDELQFIGMEGELCISGDGLSRGYLNRPDLTSNKFIDNIFIRNGQEIGKKIYKTGDLARWLEDGNVEFLGRIDHQVKIRGLRIELGEIENIIRKYKGISNCTVITRESSENITLIYAFITPEEIDIKNLKAYLKEFLPEYMLPNKYVLFNEFPLSSNGKINRKLLEKSM